MSKREHIHPRKAPYARIHIALSGRDKVQEIVNRVHASIETGDLPALSRLPPIRVLAHQLGVSKNTVAEAYDELVARGRVAKKAREGFLVLGPQRSLAKQAATFKPARLELEAGYLKPAPTPNSNGWVQLSAVLIDPDLLPKAKFLECCRSVLTRPKAYPSFYDVSGYRPLREAISKRLKHRGITADPEDIIITVGSQQAIDLVARALSQKTVAMESPAYQSGKHLFELNGAKITGLSLDPFSGPDLDVWEKALTTDKPSLLYVVSSFHNPTGYSYTSHEMSRILRLSEKLGFGILEDDWGSDMLSFSEFRAPFRTLGGEEVLYINSFTKKLLPSLRIGYIVSNPRLTPALLRVKRLTTMGNPTFVEMALHEFLDRGYFDAHLKKLHEETDRRYTLCLEALRDLMPAEVKWTRPGGGPILWLEVPPQVDLRELAEKMLRHKVNMFTPERSYLGKPHLNGFMVSYLFSPPEVLRPALEKLATEIKKLMS